MTSSEALALPHAWVGLLTWVRQPSPPPPTCGGGAGRALPAPLPRGGGGGSRWERRSGLVRQRTIARGRAGGVGGLAAAAAGALGAGGTVDTPSRLPPQRSLPRCSSLAPSRCLPHRLCGRTSQTLSPQTPTPLSRGLALSRSPQSILSPLLVPQRPFHILAPHSTPFSRVA